MADDISKEAVSYIKANKKKLLEKFASDEVCASEEHPVSIFMAGSPGAGKTEFSKRFLEKLGIRAIRIDADEVKAFIPNYNGSNSVQFQGASALGVQKIYDYALSKNKSVVLDGTFANYSLAFEDVNRSVKRKRHVEIFYIYQDPIMAWKFTLAREALEGRVVPKTLFAEAFLKSRENVDVIKKNFGGGVILDVIIKNIENRVEKFRLNVDSVSGFIDKNVKDRYTYESLMEKL